MRKSQNHKYFVGHYLLMSEPPFLRFNVADKVKWNVFPLKLLFTESARWQLRAVDVNDLKSSSHGKLITISGQGFYFEFLHQ